MNMRVSAPANRTTARKRLPWNRSQLPRALEIEIAARLSTSRARPALGGRRRAGGAGHGFDDDALASGKARMPSAMMRAMVSVGRGIGPIMVKLINAAALRLHSCQFSLASFRMPQGGLRFGCERISFGCNIAIIRCAICRNCSAC
jgi:hypothetical protein